MRGSCFLSGLLCVVAAVVEVRGPELDQGLAVVVAASWRSLLSACFCKPHTQLSLVLGARLAITLARRLS